MWSSPGDVITSELLVLIADRSTAAILFADQTVVDLRHALRYDTSFIDSRHSLVDRYVKKRFTQSRGLFQDKERFAERDMNQARSPNDVFYEIVL